MNEADFPGRSPKSTIPSDANLIECWWISLKETPNLHCCKQFLQKKSNLFITNTDLEHPTWSSSNCLDRRFCILQAYMKPTFWNSWQKSFKSHRPVVCKLWNEAEKIPMAIPDFCVIMEGDATGWEIFPSPCLSKQQRIVRRIFPSKFPSTSL